MEIFFSAYYRTAKLSLVWVASAEISPEQTCKKESFTPIKERQSQRVNNINQTVWNTNGNR